MYIITNEILKFSTNIRTIVKDHATGKVYIDDWGSNTVVNNGKYSILDRLINYGNTNEGVLTYGAVGTGSTPVAITDTDLETELARVGVSSGKYRSGLFSYLRAYFSVGVATGTLTEFAWFGGGVDGNASGVADSGTMYNRIIIDKTITATQSITVEQKWGL